MIHQELNRIGTIDLSLEANERGMVRSWFSRGSCIQTAKGYVTPPNVLPQRSACLLRCEITRDRASAIAEETWPGTPA